MRRLLFILAALLAFAAAAQSTDKSVNDSTRWSLTPHYGCGFNRPSVKTAGHVSSAVVIDAGFRFDRHLNRHWMVGGTLNFKYADGDINDNLLTIGTLGIGAGATYFWRALFVDAGLQLNVPVFSTFSNRNWEAYDGKVDIMGHTHGVNLSLPVGVGVQLRHIVLRLGADIGLTRVYNPAAVTSVRNNLVTLTIGYRFRLK